MKKSLISGIIVIILLAVSVLPALAAFSGVSGTARSYNDIRWVHGGSITVYADSGSGYATCGTGTLDANGDYSISFSCTPANFTTIYVEFVFNAGPNGTPDSQVLPFGNLPSSTGVYVLNVNTQTDPTVVTLADFTAASQAGKIKSAAAVAILFVLLIAFMFYIEIKRKKIQVF